MEQKQSGKNLARRKGLPNKFPRLYNTWNDMKRRCYCKTRKSYKNYGGRGIRVCEEWKETFSSFVSWALENGYTDRLTIDRIDNNGNYEPKNCRWIPRKEQPKNTRRNILIEYNGKIKILSEWCLELGLPYERIRQRIQVFGWNIEDAFKTEKFVGGKYGRYVIEENSCIRR